MPAAGTEPSYVPSSEPTTSSPTDLPSLVPTEDPTRKPTSSPTVSGGYTRFVGGYRLYTPIHIYIAPIGTNIGGLVLLAGTNKLLSLHLTNLGISGILREEFNQNRMKEPAFVQLDYTRGARWPLRDCKRLDVAGCG